MKTLIALGLTALLSGAFASDSDMEFQKAVNQSIVRLKPLHQPLGEPLFGDWLEQHEEPGQTFTEYLQCKPVLPQGKRNTIYIQPIGVFTTDQQKILDLTVEYMEAFYGCPVKVRKTVTEEAIPEGAQRNHPTFGMHQLLAPYILDKVLLTTLPDDAAAYIAFTSADLWPGRGWNFVFGMANTRKRVGVWSINRNGDPSESDEAFMLCLRRTIKTAIHETSHMFTLLHCTAYECGMCGSNHRGESDRRPLYFCPECNAKICWATQQNPADRYRRLKTFCKKHNLTTEAEYFAKAIHALEKK